MRTFAEEFLFDVRHGRETWRVLFTVSAFGFILSGLFVAI
jgi:hypothetical protein